MSAGSLGGERASEGETGRGLLCQLASPLRVTQEQSTRMATQPSAPVNF